MFKFCPECGVKLEKEFKFCPECGINLVENQKQENVFSVESTASVICENCGEENSPQNIVCAGCGVKLKAEKEIKELKKKTSDGNLREMSGGASPESFRNLPKRKPRQAGKSGHKPNEISSNPKALSKKKLFTILTVLFTGIILLLIFSGVFDTKKVSPSNFDQTQIKGSGVDLSNLQKINELEARVKANPNDKETLLSLAHLKNDSGLYEQAIVNYKQYLQMDPRNADARVDMGVCYYNLGDFKTAINEMETALKYQPNHQIAFLNLGIVNLSAGNLEKSKEWLKKAANQNPNNDIGKRAKELLESHTK